MNSAVIEQLFASRFERWGFRLPPETLRERQSGVIQQRGWRIAWTWGSEGGREYLEYLAQHRMSSDDRQRLWEDGETEPRPVPDSMQWVSEGAAEDELRAGREELVDRNRAIYRDLRELGLLPPEGENAPANEMREVLVTEAAPPPPLPRGQRSALKELDHDLFMADAAYRAAAAVGVGAKPTFQEAYLERAFLEVINANYGADARPRERLPVPGWDPQPLDTDLTVRFAGESTPRLIAELKVDDIEHTLWDLLKMAAITAHDASMRGYLIVAAKPRRWERAECAPLFEETDGALDWDVAEIIDRWRASWTHEMKATGRPQHLPRRLSTRLLTRAEVPAFPGYELRCTAVMPEPDGPWIEFQDGWPASQ